MTATHASDWSSSAGIGVGREPIVVLAVLVLLPGTGSVAPAGGATIATLVMVPLIPAVPVTVSVPLPPLGSVGITSPACSCVIVGDAGHKAPPLSAPQVTVLALRFATAASVTTAPFAAAG